MLAVVRFGQVTDLQQRGERFTDFRLWAGVASFNRVLSGKKTLVMARLPYEKLRG
ncbi:hypothetical protein ACFSKS_12360 [Pseudocitrobacter faecalis]